MDFSIFGSTPGSARIANTNALTLGTEFRVYATAPVFIKALRFYRQTTGIFGTIRGRVYDMQTQLPVPGTDVSVTLGAGSGATGWVTINLTAPVRLSNYYYLVAFNFPGGTGNGIPQSQNVPTTTGTTNDYWRLGPGAYGWKNGPLQIPRAQAAFSGYQCRYITGSTLQFPNQGSSADHGLDVVITDTDSSATAQSGPVWTLWGPTPPSLQVPVTAGAAVVGLEFTPVQDVWATTLRVYRPQGTRPHNDVSPTPIVSSAMTRPGDPGVTVTDPNTAVTIQGALYTVDSQSTGTQVEDSTVTFRPDTAVVPSVGQVVTEGATGWIEAYLSQPLKLTTNQRYRIVVGFRDGRPALSTFFSGQGTGAQGLSQGPLFVHGTSTATGGASSSVKTGTSTLSFPTSASDANPYLDITVTTENPNDPREPANPVRVFGTLIPSQQFSIGIGARTVALEFTASEACTAYGLRYLAYQGIAASSGRLYAVSWDGTNPPTGTPVVGSEVTFPSSPADGWQFSPFRAPIRLAAGQRYKIAIRFTNGYITTLGYFSEGGPGSGGVSATPITMPDPTGAAGTIQGSYALADGAFPDQTFNGSNPWVDLTVARTGGTPTGAAGTAGEPSAAVRVWGVGAPSGVVVANPNTRVVGLEFMVARGATAYGYRFYRATTGITGAVQVRLYSVAGDEFATEVIGADTTFTLDSTTTGWVYASLRAPVALVGGRRYKMVFFFPSGYPSTPDYFVADQPAATNDQVDAGPGILRAFSLVNATRGVQPTAMVGGTASDGVVYPSAPATDNPWLDITVVDGIASGALTTGEEPAGVRRAWGITDPAPGNITTSTAPFVAAHEVALSQSVSVYGLRMWRPDLRQQATVGRVYRVDTATTVSGTTVTFPPSTNKGWVYAPLPSPVTLEAGVTYRVAVGHPTLGPATVNALTAPVTSGVVTTNSSWTTGVANATLTFPQTPSTSNYWLDLSMVPGGGVAADTLTLFGTVPDATVATRSNGPVSLGTTFGGQLDSANTPGTFWVKALRFYRPSTTIAGTITGRIYNVTTSGRALPVAYTDVVFTLSGTGWQTAELPFPVPLSTTPWYRVAIFFPGSYPVTSNYFTTGPGGQLRYGPAGTIFTANYGYSGGDAVQGAFQAGSSLTYPYQGLSTGTTWGENYWADVVCTTSAPDVTPPPNPRFPLSYSQFGQISSTSVQIGSTFQYAQVASSAVTGARSVGIEFTVDSACYLHTYRFPRVEPALQNLTPSARLYTVNGPSSGVPVPGSDAAFTLSAEFWQNAYLPTAVPLVPGQRYKAVIYFPDATPVGIPYSDVNDKVRGPLRVLANNDATGGATATAIQSFSITYPVAGANLLAGTPIMDLYVSPTNPQDSLATVRSIFDRRRPPAITYQSWGSAVNGDGTLSSGFTAGMEFYVTTDSCYLRGFRFWKAPYPTVTQATIFKLYRVTGTAPGTYYPTLQYHVDTTTGVEVAGTTMTNPLFTSDPNQGEAYSEGWVTLQLNTPVALTPGVRYRIAAFYPDRGDEASRPRTDFFWDEGAGGAGIVDGPLIAPNRAQSTSQQQAPFDSRSILNPGPNDWPDIAFPSGENSNATHYWIDLEIYDSAPRNVDGGTVTVTIPNLVHDPRRAGVDTTSLVSPDLGVQASVVSERFSYTDPHAPPLNVTATGIGGRDIVVVNPDVHPSASGTKSVDGGVVVHEVPVVPRQAAKRPKGVADQVAVEVSPTAAAHETIEWRPMPREADVFAPEGGYGTMRFIAQDIMSRRFVMWDLPLNNPTITWNLSGPFQLSGSLNPAYVDLLDMGVDEWSTFIHVEIDGEIWGTGIMMPWSAKGEEFSIEAYGISSYAQGMPYIDTYTWSDRIPDVMDVVREMWRHIQSFPNGNMGVQIPAGILGLPVFGQPAYDDTTGEFLGWHYLTLSWTDFTDIGQYIDNLAKSQPFDYLEVDQWNSGHTDVLHGIKFGYPRVGEKRLNLRFSEGENVLEAIPISEPDDAYASDIVVKGAGEGPTQIYAWVGDTIWFRLRRVAIITDTQIQSEAAATGIAIADLIRRIYMRGIDSIVVDAFHPHAPFGSYRVGDDILVDGMIPWIGEFLLWHRIVAIALQPETGLATLTLQRSESFRYGRPDPLTGAM